MGCWNGTDALTQLAIHSGDPCRLVIILPYKYNDGMGGGYCYSIGMYEPFALPIKGHYNDYGCIDGIVEDANTQFIVRWFEEQFKAKNLVYSERAGVMDKYDDIIPKGKKIKFTIGEILEWIERGYVGLREPDNHIDHQLCMLKMHNSRPESKILNETQVEEYTKLEEEAKTGKHMRTRSFGFMLILEDTFQAALKSIGETEESFYVREGNTHKKSTWAVHVRERCDNFLRSLILTTEQKAKNAKLLAEAKTDVEKEFIQFRQESRLLMYEIGNDMWGHNLANEFMKKDCSSYVLEVLDNDGEEQVKKWLDLVYEYKLFCDFMECSRKGFVPQAGSGSQSDEYQHHQALAKAVLEICHKREIERAKSDGESEGWSKAHEYYTKTKPKADKKEAAAKAKKAKPKKKVKK